MRARSVVSGGRVETVYSTVVGVGRFTVSMFGILSGAASCSMSWYHCHYCCGIGYSVDRPFEVQAMLCLRQGGL